jgi:cyclophilin family peptidyl-prolyl cis-trans isomerase
MQKYANIFLGLGVIGLVIWILITPKEQKASVNELQNTKIESPTPMPSPKMQFEKAEQVINNAKSYTATIKTSAGNIVVKLSKDTPVTTNNFVFLAQKKFYDGVIFHRVIPGFMIQGGDPTGTGMGGPGYKFADEKFDGEYKRGVIAMANSGANTNGSQFFIMHADYPLPPNYVIFGETTEGLETVDKIAAGKTGPSDRPVTPVVIETIEITEK